MKLQIIIINLKSSVERKARITKQLDKYEIPYEFLEATEGASLDDRWIENNIDDYLKDIYYRKKHHSVNVNALACADSHRRAQILASNFVEGYTLILEDDVELTTGFDKKVKYIVKVMEKKNIHIAFLGYNLYSGNSFEMKNLKLKKRCNGVKFHSYPLDGRISGAFAYLIDSTGAKNLVQDNLYKIKDTADTFYINEKGINDSTVLLFPKLVTSGYFDSDIGYLTKKSLFKSLKKQMFIASKKSNIFLNLVRVYKEKKW